MYRHRHPSLVFVLYFSSFTVTSTTTRFGTQLRTVLLTISYCISVLSFSLHLPHFTLPYQLRIFPVDSLLISTGNERYFSILVETTAISPAIINLSTRAPINFHFQNQIANDEDKTADNTILSLQLEAWNITEFE